MEGHRVFTPVKDTDTRSVSIAAKRGSLFIKLKLKDRSNPGWGGGGGGGWGGGGGGGGGGWGGGGGGGGGVGVLGCFFCWGWQRRGGWGGVVPYVLKKKESYLSICSKSLETGSSSARGQTKPSPFYHTCDRREICKRY